MPKPTNRDAIIAGLAELLRDKRKERGLSMNELAWRSGLSHTMIMRVEKRERLPTIDTLLRITEALEADLPAMLAEAIRSVQKMPANDSSGSESRKTRAGRGNS